MPVKLLPHSFEHNNEPPMLVGNYIGVLLGKPFPSAEVQALWHMVPGQYTVEWVVATSTFIVKDIANYRWKNRIQPLGERCVPADYGHDFEYWVKTFRELHEEVRSDG